jgi:4-hydroxybenzoate polyprenyltransferase
VRASASHLESTALLGVRSLRAPQWAYFVVLPLAGFLTFDPLRVTLALVAAAACLAWSYGLNAIAERHTDASALKNPLVGVGALPRSVTLTLAATLLLALLSSSALGWTSLLAAALSLLAGTLYSTGLRLKAWPGAGLVANTLIFVPLFVLGVEGRALPGAFPTTLLVFTALLLQNQLLHELADAREDEAADALTTARSLGAAATRVFIVALAAAGALFVAPQPLALAALVLPTCAAFFPLEPSTRRRAHRVLSIVVGAVLFGAGLP